MFIDTSAVIAILAREADASDFAEKIARAPTEEVKRTMIVDALRDAGMEPHVPDGAYYVLASAKNLPGETAALKARARQSGSGNVCANRLFGALTRGIMLKQQLRRVQGPAKK